MVAAAFQISQPWSFAIAPRPLRPDRRATPRNDYVLYDGDGRPLGTVRGVQGSLELGPEAPELYLERVD